MDESQARLARNLLLLDDLEGASRIAEDEIEKVADQGNGTELWGFRFVRAEVMRLRGKPEQALMYLESRESLNHPDGQDIESQAALYMHRGYHLGLMARYEPAHKLLAEAEVIVRRGGLIELQAEVCLQQAMIFFLQKNYTVSDQIYRDVLSRSNELGGWYFRATSLRGIGKKLMNQRHYEEAMRWLEESLKMFESAGARLSTATVWSELGVCHLGLGDDTGALDLFQRSAQVNQESGAIHNYNYQVALANTGNVYLHRRDYLTALSYYEKALALAHEINDPVSVKKWTYNIRLAYARIRAAIDEQNPRTA